MKTLFFALPFAYLFVSSTAGATTFALNAQCDTAHVVPPVTGGGVASLTCALDDAAHTLVCTGQYQGLTSNPSLQHIHTGSPTENGPVLYNLVSTPGVNAGQGSLSLNQTGVTAGDVANLTSNHAYVQLHTTAHGAGEVRGVLTGPQSVDAGTSSDASTSSDAGASSSSSSSGSSGSPGSSMTSASSSGTGASSSGTSGTTSDSDGCNASGESGGDGFAWLAGLAAALAMTGASRMTRAGQRSSASKRLTP